RHAERPHGGRIHGDRRRPRGEVRRDGPAPRGDPRRRFAGVVGPLRAAQTDARGAVDAGGEPTPFAIAASVAYDGQQISVTDSPTLRFESPLRLALLSRAHPG